MGASLRWAFGLDPAGAAGVAAVRFPHSSRSVRMAFGAALGLVPAWSAELPQVAAFRSAWAKASSAPSQSLKGFDALARTEPGLADLVAWGRVQALSAKDANKAAWVMDSLAVTEGSPVAVLARERLAVLRYPEANKADSTEIAGIQEFLGHRLRADSRARLRRRLLADLAAAHRFQEAAPLASELLSGDPSLSDVRRIAQWLSPDTAFIHSPGLRLSLAQALLVGNPDSALSILDSLKARRTPSTAEWILRGRIQLELGDAEAAIAAFRHGAEDPRQEQALLWLAKGLEKVGRAEDAKTAFSEYARRWPAAPKAQEWLWSNGVDAEHAGKCDEATTWYERVKAGGGRRADWARFREGYCWFQVKEYSRAERTLSKDKRDAGAGGQREAASFFLAQAMQAQGKGAQAKAELQDLARSAPWSFHGHLARRALGTDSLFADSLRRIPDAVASLWPGERPIRLEKSDSVNLLRILCARATGDDWLAGEVSRRVDDALSGHGEREFALVRWMRSIGLAQEAGPRLRRLLGRLPAEEIAKLPKSVMREFYPMPYLKEVQPLLKGDTVLDAAFVHSVMRQESGYDRFARSGAGAVGLLQLMPSTAKAVARKVGLKGFRADRLTDPAVNLKLGVAYLRDLARVWKGRLPLVLANYNAGPSPTLRWRPAFDSLPLAGAVEQITFWETRDYVKKCMGNVWTYRLLYPEVR